MKRGHPRGVKVPQSDAQSLSDDFRRRLGLEDGDEMVAWLERAGLNLADYSAAMHSSAAVLWLQTLLDAEIEPLAEVYEKIASAT